jgi:hypothetical protein
LTTKFLPRYFPIVFALAGDSTMTKFLAIFKPNKCDAILPRRGIPTVGDDWQQYINKIQELASRTLLSGK